jgi:predicted metal-dependent peptidase
MKAKPIIQHQPEAEMDLTEEMLLLGKHCPDLWEAAMQCTFIWTMSPTILLERAATDGVYCYFVRAFMETLTPSQRAFVIGHELLHRILDHMGRGKFYRLQGFFNTKLPWVHNVYNVAADYIINAYLVRSGLEAPPEICLSDRFNGHELTDEVYVELMKEHQPEPPQDGDSGEGDPQEGGDQGRGGEGQQDGSDTASDSAESSDSGESGESGESGGSGQSGQGSGAPVETPSDGHDQHFEPVYEGSEEEQAQAAADDRREIQRQVDDVIDSAKAAGRDEPGCGMSEAGYVHRGDTPRHSNVSWKQKLAHVCNRPSSKGGRNNWGKIHRRRLISTGVVMPTKKGRIGLIALTDDMSGSVNATALKKVRAELAYIIDSLRPTRGALIIPTNTEVVESHVVNVRSGHQLLKLDIPLGGGTYMASSVKYLRRKGLVPDIHLIFTDGKMTDVDYRECAKSKAILVLDAMPYGHYGERLKASGIEYIIVE